MGRVMHGSGNGVDESLIGVRRKVDSDVGSIRNRTGYLDIELDFTIRTGTVFGESKLPIRKWYMAIYLLGLTSKGISSVQLAKHLGVTQKTAWFMAHRIRSAKKQSDIKMKGTVEADEGYDERGAVPAACRAPVVEPEQIETGAGDRSQVVAIGVAVAVLAGVQ